MIAKLSATHPAPARPALLCSAPLMPLKQSPSLGLATRHEVLQALTCQRRGKSELTLLDDEGI